MFFKIFCTKIFLTANTKVLCWGFVTNEAWYWFCHCLIIKFKELRNLWWNDHEKRNKSEVKLMWTLTLKKKRWWFSKYNFNGVVDMKTWKKTLTNCMNEKRKFQHKNYFISFCTSAKNGHLIFFFFFKYNMYSRFALVDLRSSDQMKKKQIVKITNTRKNHLTNIIWMEE